MKTLKLIAIFFFLIGCKNEKNSTIIKDDLALVDKGLTVNNQLLIVVEQDYNKALKIASKQNKLIFIDFYTTWCAPCKVLDKLVFQNDSIGQILKKDFILLRYDAENDSVFHLSKKHHVLSYPTGLVLNKNGYVLNRKYGFPGGDFKTLSKSVVEFTNESVELNKEGKILKGYSNQIDASKYPIFYNDYVNRTNTKINSVELNNYWNNHKDIFSEEYFSTVLYFSKYASDDIVNRTLKNKEKYLQLYGKTDVDIVLFLFSAGKLDQAISEKNQKKYDEAVAFAKSALSKKWTDDILPKFEKDFLKAQNKWAEVFEINRNLKNKGEFDNGYINHFSWQVYEDCDDKEVIKNCLKWMKEVTDEEPTYAYLDTYAHLMFKSGNIKETKRIAQLAIEAAKKDNESTKNINKLTSKL